MLIIADDLGWKNVGFMGSTFYETPNLDRLAAQGMKFTSAYTAAAMLNQLREWRKKTVSIPATPDN